MLWGEVKYNPMAGVSQKRSSGRHRFENAPFALNAQVQV